MAPGHRTLVAAFVAFFLTTSASATTYYVAPNGNDGNPGTTPGQPWRTIQRAVSQPVAPGDIVMVADGTYVGWATDIAGTPSAPIQWIASGSQVIIDRPVVGGPGNPNDNIRLMYADYNVIDGFQSTNAPRAGIAVRGDPDQPIVGAIVRRCNAHDNQTWGIFDAFAERVTYELNVCSGSRDQHGIYHSNSGDDPVIRSNVCFGNHAAGLHMNGDASQGGDGVISRALIEQNVIYGNGVGGGAGINMDGVQDSLIRNNLLYDNHASGMICYQIDGGAPSKGNVFVNNTVIMADDGRWALKVVDGATGCVAFNNVLYRNHAFRGSISLDAASLPGFVSDHNVVVDRFSIDGDNTKISLAEWQSITGQDVHSILIDVTTLPDFFVDPGHADWHLKDASPAVDAGLATLSGHAAPPVDFEGDPRPAGSGFDIGADEQTNGCVAAWHNYGTGWPGTLGIPSLTASAPPRLASTITIDVGNSRGATTPGLLLLGASAASTPTSLGGTLLVLPAVLVPITIPAPGASLPASIPDDPALCGVAFYAQVLEQDPGASRDVSFTAGLQLVLGQ
jgi:hypothetical protein